MDNPIFQIELSDGVIYASITESDYTGWQDVTTYTQGTPFVLRAEIIRNLDDEDSTEKASLIIKKDDVIVGTYIIYNDMPDAGAIKVDNIKGVSRIYSIIMTPADDAKSKKATAPEGVTTIKSYAQFVNCSGERENYDQMTLACGLYGSDEKSLPGQRVCSMNDLKLFLDGADSDSGCFEEALYYCSEYTYPVLAKVQDEGVVLPYKSHKYSAACSTELLLHSTVGTVGVDMGNSLWAFAKSNLILVIIVAVIIVILLPVFVSKRR